MKLRLLALYFILMATLAVVPLERIFAAPAQGVSVPELKVLAVETFLADIARNVAGERSKVSAMLPVGADPHGYDPTPSDIIKVANSNVLVVNGAGFEEFLERLLKNAGGVHRVIDASAGLKSRTPQKGEEVQREEVGDQGGEHKHHEWEDPHFWMSPVNVIKYVENIKDGLTQADPPGAAVYSANADTYIAKLKDLDRWIEAQVKQIPPDRRLLVTNHESLGYFADRYGFKIIGTIVPSVSPEASPSAQQLAHLIDRIKASGVHAIFLETGTNQQLPKQVARDTGVKVEELYDHSLSEPGGPAPDYIAMMKYDATTIVDALK